MKPRIHANRKRNHVRDFTGMMLIAAYEGGIHAFRAGRREMGICESRDGWLDGLEMQIRERLILAGIRPTDRIIEERMTAFLGFDENADPLQNQRSATTPEVSKSHIEDAFIKMRRGDDPEDWTPPGLLIE